MFSIDIRGNNLSIDNDKVSYKGELLYIKDIDKILANDSRNFPAVWYGDKYGKVIKVKFDTFLGISSTPLEKYKKVGDQNHSIIIPSILQRINTIFNNGDLISIGDCTMNKDGIFFIETTLFISNKNKFIRWKDIGIYKNDMFEILIKDEINNKFIITFNMKTTWNSILLQAIKNTVLDIKPVLPPSPRVM